MDNYQEIIELGYRIIVTFTTRSHSVVSYNTFNLTNDKSKQKVLNIISKKGGKIKIRILDIKGRTVARLTESCVYLYPNYLKDKKGKELVGYLG